MQFGRGKPSVGAFFDSDFTSIDSLLALAVLYGLQGKNDCRVATVTMSRPNLAVAGFADAVVRFYHGPAANFAQLPPVGMRTEGAAGETSPAFTVPFEKKKVDGTPVYKNAVKSVIDTGDPNTLLRNYLLAQSDQNAFFLLAGPATDLAAALEFRGMKELLKAKIKYLVMAGPQTDVASAKKVAAEWPTPIIDVPQLSNVAYSGPYLHDGSARSLEEIWTVFNPKDMHGVTNDLTKDELNDLVEYLKTL